jgi:hypothetical protein
MALIRRGAGHIVVVDAEHDPDYRFGAYQELRNNLKLYGATLRIEDIDTLLKENPTKLPLRKSAFKGTVSFGGYASPPKLDIVYLKMAIPQSLIPLLTRDGAAFKDGEAAEKAYKDALRRSSAGGRWQCSKLDSRLDEHMRSWSAYQVRSYADYLRTSWRARLLDAVGHGGAKIHFPQYSTWDQSYYTDQAKALIGLGYLQAMEGFESGWLPPASSGREKPARSRLRVR